MGEYLPHHIPLRQPYSPHYSNILQNFHEDTPRY